MWAAVPPTLKPLLMPLLQLARSGLLCAHADAALLLLTPGFSPFCFTGGCSVGSLAFLVMCCASLIACMHFELAKVLRICITHRRQVRITTISAVMHAFIELGISCQNGLAADPSIVCSSVAAMHCQHQLTAEGPLALLLLQFAVQYMHSILSGHALTTGATEQVFDQGHELGFCMRILDIGGGFAGGSFDSTGTVQLGRVPLAVNTALDTFFPDPSVKVSKHT